MRVLIGTLSVQTSDGRDFNEEDLGPLIDPISEVVGNQGYDMVSSWVLVENRLPEAKIPELVSGILNESRSDKERLQAAMLLAESTIVGTL